MERAPSRRGRTPDGPPSSASSSRQVVFRSSLHNTVYDVMNARKWLETDAEVSWDIFWADTHWVHDQLDHVQLAEHQRVNHFRNHYELTRKDLLVKNLRRARKQLEREDRHAEASSYDFFPQTYTVPAEYNLFVEEFKRTGGVWIMKPVGRAQGKGIFLFTKLSQIAEWRNHRFGADGSQAESYVAQRYIERPYLIGGKKFDLRIYVLVLSYSPLRVYLYRDAFCRFSASPYSSAKADLDNLYMHLTNAAVQKTSSGYHAETGMKWPMRALKLHLASRHGTGRVNGLMLEIQDLILKSLQAVQNTIINDRHCFELYGYDVMLDEDLKPWLIEVNASPSLTADTQADYELKFAMLDDALTVVDMERRLPRGPGAQMGGWDLIHDHTGPVTSRAPPALPSMLGSYNNRLKNLRDVFAQ